MYAEENSVLLVCAIQHLSLGICLHDIEEEDNGLECYNANHAQDLGRMQSINEVIQVNKSSTL